MKSAVVFVVAFVLNSPASAAISRFTSYLDGGVSITVDNASGWSNSDVSNLVLAADRSTREECVYSWPDVKGLFATGDQIYVSQNYIAWFDFTAATDYSRSGELAGFWTLDPSTHLFKHYRTGPNNCWNWPANELIPGSASPNGQTNWWDLYGPPVEHTLVAVPTGGGSAMFMSSVYAQSTSASGFTRQSDVFNGDNAHYRVTGKMTSWNSRVDISDDNDGNGVSQWIESDIEYICRPDDILSLWRFKPTTNVNLTNLYVYLWASYAQQDLDGTSCDVAAGEQWPSTSHVTKPPMYAQASGTLTRNWDNASYSSGSIAPMVLGSACGDDYNHDIYMTSPGDGSWLRWGASSTLSSSEPRFQLLNLGVPGSGSGTYSDPYRPQMGSMVFAHERSDATLGAGILKHESYSLQGNKWYQIYFGFRSNY
ncbi:MAG: hypothetical protein M3P06_13325 [Acidobacteriota bacterium]|nr:hypothetical protein [Acidobacteriota bacterium]